MANTVLNQKHGKSQLPETGFVRLPTILAVFPISKTSWWDGVKNGRYPKSIKPHSSSSSKTVTLKQFLESCKEKAEQAIPEDDSVFAYAETVGLEREMVAVCWQEFKAAYLPKKKRYSDWRKAFNNAVRGNYYGLWFCKEGEPMSWTSKGQQARRAAA